jgi:nucleotide-binding universal stress UspA family protein
MALAIASPYGWHRCQILNQDVAVTFLTMLCTDGSELATEALAAGLRVLAPADHTLVVTAVDPVDDSLVYGASGLAGGVVDEQQYADMVGAQRDAADTILRGAVTALGLDGVATVEMLAVEGEPGRALCDLAAERGATVIVAGTRGRGGLKRAVLGSVSDHLVRNAPCPVLVVGARDD